MPKLIPHRIIAKDFENDPVIKLLKGSDGTSYLDQKENFVDIECELFSIIPLVLSKHPALALLTAKGLLDLSSPDNQTYLPVDRFQAYSW